MKNAKAVQTLINKIDDGEPFSLTEIESFIINQYNIKEMEDTLKSYELVDKFLRQLANMDYLDNNDGIVQIAAKALLEMVKR